MVNNCWGSAHRDGRTHTIHELLQFYTTALQGRRFEQLHLFLLPTVLPEWTPGRGPGFLGVLNGASAAAADLRRRDSTEVPSSTSIQYIKHAERQARMRQASSLLR